MTLVHVTHLWNCQFGKPALRSVLPLEYVQLIKVHTNVAVLLTCVSLPDFFSPTSDSPKLEWWLWHNLWRFGFKSRSNSMAWVHSNCQSISRCGKICGWSFGISQDVTVPSCSVGLNLVQWNLHLNKLLDFYWRTHQLLSIWGCFQDHAHITYENTMKCPL